MKKWAVLLVIAMIATFTACTKEEDQAEETEPQPTVQTYQRVEEEEEAPPPSAEDILRERLSVAYEGELEDGTTLYFSQTPDNALAIFLLVSDGALLQGCAGRMTVAENEFTVTDILNGETVEFAVREDDGKLYLDGGEWGGAYLDYVPVESVCDLLFSQVDYAQAEL